MRTKLSPSMIRVMQNLAAGLPAGAHCRGQSQFGGCSGTVYALVRRGFIDTRHRLTKSGRIALIRHAQKG
jgi:hypothetical protein